MKILLAIFAFTLHAGWVVQPGSARIQYSETAGHETFEAALKEMADAGRIQSLNGIIAYSLLSKESFQKELFAALERDAPRELKEALTSAGNMHNPKMHQLWKRFEKSFLTTPTITKLNTSLAPHALTLSSVSMEKFSIIKSRATSPPRFFGILWLTITKAPAPPILTHPVAWFSRNHRCASVFICG
jgi:hypothetical protein